MISSFSSCFHVTSSPPCWWTKTKDLSLASFVRPPEVYISLLLLVSPEVGGKRPMITHPTKAKIIVAMFREVLQ